MQRWLISYDVSSDKHRQKIAKTLLDYGERVQFSVFECDINEKELKRLVSKLTKLIENSDSIRYYRLCSACRNKTIVTGRSENYIETEYLVV